MDRLFRLGRPMTTMSRVTSLIAILPLLTTLSYASTALSHDSPLYHRAHHFGSPASSPAEDRALEKRNILSKRDFSGRATFYSVGLGACGGTNSNSDFVVALNQPQYQADNWCYKMITISYGGKSTQAQIVDECPGCPYGGLDMSPALFQNFADESAGVFYMTWYLGDGSYGGSSTTSSSQLSIWSQSSSTTSSWTPTSTSTWTTSSSSSSSSSSSASSSILSASSTSTGLKTAKATPAAVSGGQVEVNGTQSAAAYDVMGNLSGLSQLVIGLGSLVASGTGQLVGSS